MVARQYTARDQLGQIDYNTDMVATFAYDAGSRRTSRVLGDTPGTQTAWVYGRQDHLPTAINAGVAGASFTYTYDANKNKLTEDISAPMTNYGFNSTAYDPADRLTTWNRTDGNLDQAWNLSLVGNWATFTENQVQQTRTHTAVHEIAAIDAAPLAHDAAGNLTRTAGDLFDRYTWDFDNRLLAADVDQDGTAECGYRYDALGRRVSKTVPDGEGSATTVFVGSIEALAHSPHAKQVLAEYAADAQPASPACKFVYAEYIDEPVLMVRLDGPAETHYYYHQNSLYSVAAVTDATGAVVERYAYSAYGKPLFLDAAANLLDPQASTIGNPYLFTGRRLDEETGLYYYRARMYDAALGRFVGRDPIGYEDGLSLYLYVQANPSQRLDPTGGKSRSRGGEPPKEPPGGWGLDTILDCYTGCFDGFRFDFPCKECMEDCYKKHRNLCFKEFYGSPGALSLCNLQAKSALETGYVSCATKPSSPDAGPCSKRQVCCYVRVQQSRGQTYTTGKTIDCEPPQTARQCCVEQVREPLLWAAEGGCK